MKKVMLVLFLGMAVLIVNAQTKTAVKPVDLPKEINENLTKDYKDYQVVNAFKVNTKEIITFEVMAKKDKEFLILTYDAAGKFLKKVEPRKDAMKAREEQKKNVDMKKEEPKKEEPKKPADPKK